MSRSIPKEPRHILRRPFLWAACVAAPLLLNGQNPAPPQQSPDQGTNTRDLKPVRPPENNGSTPNGDVPQSYALVIGIGH